MKNLFFILLVLILQSCYTTSHTYSEPSVPEGNYDKDDNIENEEYNGDEPGDLGQGGYNEGEQEAWGRRVNYIPNLGPLMHRQIAGIIVVNMCVNPAGDVVSVELNKEETTITNKEKIREALKVAKKYKYEKDINAPDLQCGKFTFKLEVERN